MNKYIFFLLLISVLFCPLHSFSKEYDPEEIENPNLRDRRIYVADPAHLVGDVALSKANATLWNLRQETGAEVVVVVSPNTGDYSEEDFATKLFENWKVGKSDKDNGVLVLIVPDQRSARIATGYGVEGIIPDISAKRIINRSIVPYMKDGDLDGAVVAVSNDLATVLSEPEAANELKSSQAEVWDQVPASDITTEDLITFTFFVVLAIFLFSIAKYAYDCNRLKKLDQYSQARGWHDDTSTYLILAFLSLGLGFLPYFLAKRKYQKSRNTPMKCPACRGLMHKLSEEEDNKLLSPSQDLEERLNSVDYDVWVCEDCGSVERFAFPNKQSKYEECPNCHTKAMYLVKDHTLTPATTRSTGVGEKIYDCKYCHTPTKRRYTIPRREDGKAAAIAAGAILGSGRGGSGFGSGLGGGFGGGRTGGGGATGRW